MSAHLYRVVQDGAGNTLNGASITICNPGTQTAITPQLYADAGLTVPLSNPFTAIKGIVDVYLASPQAVAIMAIYRGNVTISDYIDALPLAEDILATLTPLAIVNDHFPGAVLQVVDATTAQWVQAPSNWGGWYQTYSATGPLSVQTGTERIYNDTGTALTATSVMLSVGTAPQGADLILDVLKNGTSIYTTIANRPTITAGQNAAQARLPDDVTFAADDYLTVSILQVGSTTPGSDLTVQLAYTGTPGLSPSGAAPVITGTGDTTSVSITSTNPGAGTSDAPGVDAVAVGPNTSAAAQDTTAVGSGAFAAKINGVAVGPRAAAQDLGGVAVGASATAFGPGSVAIGTDPTDTIGSVTGAWADATRAVAIGPSTIVSGDYGVAIGCATQATGYGAVAMGPNASAAGGGVAIGGYDSATLTTGTKAGISSIAMGPGASALGSLAVAIGYSADADAGGSSSVAIGPNALAYGGSCVAIGSTAQTNLSGSASINTVAIGTAAFAKGNYAMGLLGTANADGSVAIGTDHTASAAQADTMDDFVLGTALHNYKMPGTLEGQRRAIVTKTANYSVAATDCTVLANGAITITLPNAATSNYSGKVFTIKNIGTGTVTVASFGGTIDGAASVTLTTQYAHLTVQSDGTNWWVIG